MHSLSAQHCQTHCTNPKVVTTWSQPSKPSEPIRNHQIQNLRNRSHFPNRNLLELIETWNHLRNPGTCRKPSNGTTFGSRNRFPEPGSFPEPPHLAQNTPKSRLCKDPIAFCCWGKKKVGEQEKWDKDIFFFLWQTSLLQKIFLGGDYSRRGLLRLRGGVSGEISEAAGGEHAVDNCGSGDLRVLIQIPGSSEWPFGFWHFQGWILERPFRKTHWKTEK